MNRSQYHSKVMNAVPAGFFEDTLRCLCQSYGEAYKRGHEDYPDSEAHDLIPHLRRANVERDMRNLAQRHGLHGRAALNVIRNSFHTRIIMDDIVMTISATMSPNEKVRDAEFRKSYANDPQCHLPLFPEDPPTIDIRRDGLYVLLKHGPNCEDPAKLGFARIVFPTPDCSGYACEDIDLWAKFSHVLKDFYAPAHNDAGVPPDAPPPPIKIKQQRPEEQA